MANHMRTHATHIVQTVPDTYQRWHRVGGALARPVAHRGDLLAGELARLHVGAQHGGQQARLVVQLGGQGALVAAVLGALLHGGEDAGFLALGHATESDGCEEETGEQYILIRLQHPVNT